jgi:hypothetical protein
MAIKIGEKSVAKNTASEEDSLCIGNNNATFPDFMFNLLRVCCGW